MCDSKDSGFSVLFWNYKSNSDQKMFCGQRIYKSPRGCWQWSLAGGIYYLPRVNMLRWIPNEEKNRAFQERKIFGFFRDSHCIRSVIICLKSCQGMRKENFSESLLFQEWETLDLMGSGWPSQSIGLIRGGQDLLVKT